MISFCEIILISWQFVTELVWSFTTQLVLFSGFQPLLGLSVIFLIYIHVRKSLSNKDQDIFIKGPKEIHEKDNVKIEGKVTFHPSLKYIKWQKLKRGEENVDININSERYAGSSNEIGNPILCINSVNTEDETEYRLEVRKGDKRFYSNAYLLQMTYREDSKKSKIEIASNKKDGQYILGDNITITTDIKNKSNVLCLTWQKETEEGVEVINTKMPKYEKSSTRIQNSVLHISSVTSEDNAFFYLLAASTNGQIESNKVHIQIKGEKPRVSLQKKPGDVSINIGDTVKYWASIRSTPALSKVVWKKGENVIYPKDPKYTGTTYFSLNPVLIINKLNKEDEGVYEIEVTNPVGTTCSSERLVVKGAAPEISLNPLPESPHNYGSSVTIVAEIHSCPKPSIIKWLKVNGKDVEEVKTESTNCNLTETSTESLKSFIIINNLDYTDTGTYRIFVENAVDSTTKEINIDVQGIPKLFISGPSVVSPSSTAEYWTMYDALINKDTTWQKTTITEGTNKNNGPKMVTSILEPSYEEPFQKVKILHKKLDSVEKIGQLNQDNTANEHTVDEVASTDDKKRDDSENEHLKQDDTTTDLLQLSDGSMKSNRINTIVDVYEKFGTEAENNCLRFFHLQSICTEAMRMAFDKLPPVDFQKKLQKFENQKVKKSNLFQLYDTSNPPTSSKDLDITLMYAISRNMGKQSSKKWKEQSEKNAIGIERDFDRIHEFRNTICHLPACELDTPTFNDATLNLITIISRLTSADCHLMQEVCRILNMVCCAGTDVTKMMNFLREENSRLEKFLAQGENPERHFVVKKLIIKEKQIERSQDVLHYSMLTAKTYNCIASHVEKSSSLDSIIEEIRSITESEINPTPVKNRSNLDKLLEDIRQSLNWSVSRKKMLMFLACSIMNFKAEHGYPDILPSCTEGLFTLCFDFEDEETLEQFRDSDLLKHLKDILLNDEYLQMYGLKPDDVFVDELKNLNLLQPPAVHLNGPDELYFGQSGTFLAFIENISLFNATVIWQKKGGDGKKICIDINDGKYRGSSLNLPAPVLCVHFVRKQDEGKYKLKLTTKRGDKICSCSKYLIVTIQGSIEDVPGSHLEEERREVEIQRDAIGFHKQHTSNLVLLHEGTLARRIIESEWRSICFSNRPISLDENVYVRIAEISSDWIISPECGLTNIDPGQIQDMEKEDSITSAVRLGEGCPSLNLNDVLCFSIKKTTDAACEFSISVNEQSCFYNRVNSVSIWKPIWLVFGVMGRVSAIEITNIHIKKFQQTLDVYKYNFTDQS